MSKRKDNKSSYEPGKVGHLSDPTVQAWYDAGRATADTMIFLLISGFMCEVISIVIDLCLV